MLGMFLIVYWVYFLFATGYNPPTSEKKQQNHGVQFLKQDRITTEMGRHGRLISVS